MKEGIVTSTEQVEKVGTCYIQVNTWMLPNYISSFTLSSCFQEEIAKLLRFESSRGKPGENVSIPQYCSRLKEGQKEVYYLAAPRYFQY